MRQCRSAPWLIFLGVSLTLGALLSATAGPAFAAELGRPLGHVERIESDPEPGATLPRAPAGVFVTFSSPVSAESELEVLGSAFQRVDVGGTRVEPDGVTLSVGLQPDAMGELTVQYSAIDVADGHATNGSFSFTVDPDSVMTGTVLTDTVEAESIEAVGPEATEPEATEPDEADPEAVGQNTGGGDGAEGNDGDGPGLALILGLLVAVGAGILVFAARRRRTNGPPGIGILLLCTLLFGAAGCGSPASGPDPTQSAPAVAEETEVTDAGPQSEDGSPPEAADAVGASTVVAASDLGVGQDRFAFALLDRHGAPIADADASVTFYHLDGEVARPVAEAAATYYPGAIEGAGLYVVNTEFDRPGPWGAQIQAALPDGSPVQTQRIRFEVSEDPAAPAVGERVPETKNPTLDDASLEEITSDPDPDSAFYSMTVDEAVASGQPTVVVFATPAYCASRICGPVLDEVKSVAADWSDAVNFIHIEVYETFEPLELSPLMDQWGLTTEPWVFVIDEEGRVAARLEGNVTAAELEPILEQIAEQREGRGPGAGAHLSHDPLPIL